MTLITSQRFLDETIVEEKQSTGDYEVMISPEFEIDGEKFAVILDGHHSYEAAKRDGFDPDFFQATLQDSDNIALIDEDVELFLEAVYIDSDYYDAETGIDL